MKILTLWGYAHWLLVCCITWHFAWHVVTMPKTFLFEQTKNNSKCSGMPTTECGKKMYSLGILSVSSNRKPKLTSFPNRGLFASLNAKFRCRQMLMLAQWLSNVSPEVFMFFLAFTPNVCIPAGRRRESGSAYIMKATVYPGTLGPELYRKPFYCLGIEAEPANKECLLQRAWKNQLTNWHAIAGEHCFLER